MFLDVTISVCIIQNMTSYSCLNSNPLPLGPLWFLPLFTGNPSLQHEIPSSDHPPFILLLSCSIPAHRHGIFRDVNLFPIRSFVQFLFSLILQIPLRLSPFLSSHFHFLTFWSSPYEVFLGDILRYFALRVILLCNTSYI